jgi:hypothetical protein
MNRISQDSEQSSIREEDRSAHPTTSKDQYWLSVFTSHSNQPTPLDLGFSRMPSMVEAQSPCIAPGGLYAREECYPVFQGGPVYKRASRMMTERQRVNAVHGRGGRSDSGTNKRWLSQAPTAKLRTAHRTGRPVKGKVKRTNRGGLVVKVGGCRCFCPRGQIGPRRSANGRELVGSVQSFVVVEVKKSVVLSREEFFKPAQKELVWELANLPGGRTAWNGIVRKVLDRGVLVDIGYGLLGYLPIDGHGEFDKKEGQYLNVLRGTRFPWTPDKPLSWRPGDQRDEPEKAAQA